MTRKMILTENKSFIPLDVLDCPLNKTRLYYDEYGIPVGEFLPMGTVEKEDDTYYIHRIVCGCHGMSYEQLKEESGISVDTPDEIDIFAERIKNNEIAEDTDFGKECHKWYNENYLPGLVDGKATYSFCPIRHA